MKWISSTFIVYFYFITYSQALTHSIPALSNSWNNVVQISSEAPDHRGESIPSYCNATFIHKHVLITAAHCLKWAYLSGFKKIKIEVGEYKYVTRKTDGEIVRIGYVPKFKITKDVNIELPTSLTFKLDRQKEKTKILPTEDIALIWWAEETPEFQDIILAEVVSPLLHNEIIKNISNTILNVLSINFFVNSTLDYRRISTLNNYKWQGYVYSKSLSRIEEGDSGAPLFAMINGRPKLFGVVKGKASSILGNWDAYPTINPHLCDLSKALPSFIEFPNCNRNLLKGG